MRVYVGTYGKYNAGSLKGEWMDLKQYVDAEDFATACRELHKDEYDPEYMFQDWEDIPSSLVWEGGISENVFWYVNDCEEKEAFAAYCEHFGYDISEDNYSRFEDCYRGEWESEKAFADNYIEESGEWDQIPSHLQFYFDLELYARDLFINDFTYCDGFVFLNH